MEKVTLKTLFPGFSRVVDFLGKTWIYPSKRHQWLLSVTQGNTIGVLSHDKNEVSEWHKVNV